jgi:hypothetical protein
MKVTPEARLWIGLLHREARAINAAVVAADRPVEAAGRTARR